MANEGLAKAAVALVRGEVFFHLLVSFSERPPAAWIGWWCAVGSEDVRVACQNRTRRV